MSSLKMIDEGTTDVKAFGKATKSFENTTLDFFTRTAYAKAWILKRCYARSAT